MQPGDRRTITLVLGGVRSGKSRWAQQLAEAVEHVAYVATAQAIDDEMRQKIRRHQEDRPAHWTTFEEPLELAQVLTNHAAEFDLMLVDCLTVFVANLLMDAEEHPWANVQISQQISEQTSEHTFEVTAAQTSEQNSITERTQNLLQALRTAPVSIVLVSNEVGSGVVPPFPSGRKYRDALGELNQRVAAIADNVVLMVAGLPLVLKGTLNGPIKGTYKERL